MSTHNDDVFRKKGNNVFPCLPHFYCIKVGCMEILITWICLHDA